MNRAGYRVRFTALSLLVIFVAVSVGCQQGVYRPGSIPGSYNAPPPVDAQSMNLSALGGTSRASNIIYPGDVLDVYVQTGVETEKVEASTVQVNDDGTAGIPLVGTVSLAGLPFPQAGSAVRQASIERGIYRNPNVSVLLKERQANQITVVGEVEEPGPYELAVANSNLLAALSTAGGLTEDASTIIEIKHPTTVFRGQGSRANAVASYPPPEDGRPRNSTIRLDLKEATTHDGNFPLIDGSVVMVMKQEERSIHVSGLVNKPDRYVLPRDRDLRLSESLAAAGGRTLQIANKVKIIRKGPKGGRPIVIMASVRQAKNKPESHDLRLAPGDIISVEETPTTFMVQTLRDFVRFGFSAGSTLF